MIGIAFAAIANGISAVLSVRHRASTRAVRIATEQPISQPPRASWNVNQPALQRVSRSVQSVWTISDGGGSRNSWMFRPRTSPSHRPIPTAKTTTAVAQTPADAPSERAARDRLDDGGAHSGIPEARSSRPVVADGPTGKARTA